jgi:glutamate carboxypeptidase
MTQIHTFLSDSYNNFLADLAALVNVDCGTHNKAGVDSVASWIAARCAEWDWTVERLSLPNQGDCVVARLRGTGQGRLMLIGHLDTVYPDGTAATRPMWFEGSKILGPGTCDMKSGLLVGMYALRALQVSGFNNFEELTFFFNSDEEIGSPVSRTLYSPIAQSMDAALVFESARANGDIVSARKGSGEYKLTVTGKAAHAGVEPHKGANAVLELAHQILALRQLDGFAPGVTVNPDVIGGGTKSNVIADEAWVIADVRALDNEGADCIRQKLENWPSTTTVPGTQVSLSGHFSFAPMGKTPATGLLADLAKAAATDLGFTINDVATGGASDANTIAGLGVPVLDGLGPIGGLDHSPNEYIEAPSITPRTELAATLILQILEHRQQLAALRS